MRGLISAIFKPAQAVPDEYRRNFTHLYFDIGWFGVLNGSALAFLSIYAARLGASSSQIGLISAVPSIVSIILALPAGGWIANKSVRRVAFITSIMQRSFYLLFAFFPLMLTFMSKQTQVWVLIGCILLMSVPAAVLGLGFNTLFASATPIDWRGHVGGIRNAIFALTTIVVTLISGQILQQIPFPDGYAWVFGLGAIGGFMSSLHLAFVKPLDSDLPQRQELEKDTKIGKHNILNRVRVDVLQGVFGRTLFLLFCFYIAQYLPLPLFSIYSVNVLNLPDQVISLGTAIFNVMIFLGSTQFSKISRKWGNKTVTGVGLVLLGFYPVLLSFAQDASLYLVANIVGGFAWSLAGGALFNYLLESVPANDRPAHLAWFALGSNTAILLASLIGPMIGETIGLSTALILFGVLRIMTGITIVRWG